jgi:hypothetical protein
MTILSAVVYGSLLFWALVASAFAAAAILVLTVVRTSQHDAMPAQMTPADTLMPVSQFKALREIIAGKGYDYDWTQDVFFSTRNPWQKQFGYCRLYDEAAAPLGMIVDSEPIYFDYGGRRWLIELWKGQYGLTAGAEIGLYNTSGADLDIPGVFNGTFYEAADEDDWLRVSFTLFKDETAIIRRQEVHWWLTGFRLGLYARPSSLKMQATITFPDRAMRDAFLIALIKLGYGNNEFRVNGTAVMILFSKPHSKQPLTRRSFIAWLALRQDKRLVRKYERLTKGRQNMYENIMLLKARAPALYRLVMKMGRQKELFSQYDMLRQYRS